MIVIERSNTTNHDHDWQSQQSCPRPWLLWLKMAATERPTSQCQNKLNSCRFLLRKLGKCVQNESFLPNVLLYFQFLCLWRCSPHYSMRTELQNNHDHAKSFCFSYDIRLITIMILQNKRTPGCITTLIISTHSLVSLGINLQPGMEQTL